MIGRTSRQARTAALTLVAVLASTAACSRAFKEPEVRLDRVSVGSLGFEGGVLRVRLVVVNPNGFGLRTNDLRYTFQIAEDAASNEWQDFTEGRFDEDVIVEAHDSTLVEIPIRFSYRDVGAAVRAALARGAFDYRVTGSVHLVEPLRRDIPFRRDGTIELF